MSHFVCPMKHTCMHIISDNWFSKGLVIILIHLSCNTEIKVTLITQKSSFTSRLTSFPFYSMNSQLSRSQKIITVINRKIVSVVQMAVLLQANLMTCSYLICHLLFSCHYELFGFHINQFPVFTKQMALLKKKSKARKWH